MPKFVVVASHGVSLSSKRVHLPACPYPGRKKSPMGWEGGGLPEREDWEPCGTFTGGLVGITLYRASFSQNLTFVSTFWLISFPKHDVNLADCPHLPTSGSGRMKPSGRGAREVDWVEASQDWEPRGTLKAGLVCSTFYFLHVRALIVLSFWSCASSRECLSAH